MRNYIRLTSLVQRMVLSGEIAIGEKRVLSYAFKHDGEKRKPEVPLELETNHGELEGQAFTYFSMAVHNAVMSLCDGEQKIFTTLDIARVLCGDPKRRFNRAGRFLEQIEEELEKMASVRIFMDLQSEIIIQNREFYGEDGEIHTIDSPILSFDKVPVKQKNGRVIQGYRLTETPPFYLYSKNTGQMDSLNIEHNRMKQIGKADRFAIRELLYDRILMMKNKAGIASNFNRINIEKLRDVSEKIAGRHLSLKDIEPKTDAILEDWVKSSLLNDWFKEKEKQTGVISYVIELNLQGVAAKSDWERVGKEKVYGESGR